MLLLLLRPAGHGHRHLLLPLPFSALSLNSFFFYFVGPFLLRRTPHFDFGMIVLCISRAWKHKHRPDTRGGASRTELCGSIELNVARFFRDSLLAAAFQRLRNERSENPIHLGSSRHDMSSDHHQRELSPESLIIGRIEILFISSRTAVRFFHLQLCQVSGGGFGGNKK